MKTDSRAPTKNRHGTNNKDNEASTNIVEVEDASVLALNKLESWVIDSRASFHATSNKERLKNYMQSDLDTVFLGNDKPCNIVDKRDVLISLSNVGTWMLNDVRHVLCLKRNLILVGQLTSSGYSMVFTGDS